MSLDSYPSPSQLCQVLLAIAGVLIVCAAVVSPHGTHGEKKSTFRDPEVVRNREHVQEHLEELTGKEKQEEDMTDEELEFHYFKLHDFDNNTKLDGLEILAAINHMMDHEEMDKSKTAAEETEKRLSHNIEMIDQVLKDDDFNDDGYLTYLEFVLARRRAEAEAKKYEKKQ